MTQRLDRIQPRSPNRRIQPRHQPHADGHPGREHDRARRHHRRPVGVHRNGVGDADPKRDASQAAEERQGERGEQELKPDITPPRPHGPAVLAQDLRTGREQAIPAIDDPELVVDAGFDNYVRLRWDDLLDGKRVKFPLRLLSLDSPVDMRAQVIESDCPAGQLCIEVEVDSWLLGLLAGPIKLRYDREDRSLLYFSGVSNLKDDDGESQEVVIRYDYAPVALARALPDEVTPDLP